MSDLRERQKVEAVRRMRKLKMLDQPIKEFANEGVLNLSEQNGALYWLNDNEKGIVKRFEKEYGGLVYHVIKSYTNFGLMYSLLFITKHAEEWGTDYKILDDGYAFAYVFNASMPDCSEYGTIAIKPCIGGVVRVF